MEGERVSKLISAELAILISLGFVLGGLIGYVLLERTLVEALLTAAVSAVVLGGVLVLILRKFGSE